MSTLSSRPKMVFAGFLLLIAPIAILSPVHAQVYDFESSTATYVSPPAGGTRPGALTSLSLTSAGLTATITRPGGTPFDIVSNTDNQAGKPISWGTNSLDPFFAPGDNGWIINFDKPINTASIQFGDYGSDNDTLTMFAFSSADGGGTLIASNITNYSTNAFPTFGTVSVIGAGIRSLVLVGTSDAVGFANSTFLDNLQVTVAPEPTSLLFLGSAGISGMIVRRRRKR